MEYRVLLPKWAIPHWWVVAYKIVPELIGEYRELVEIEMDDRFKKVVSKYVANVIENGAMPPADVAPAILNLANDLVNGRDMVIRTGDYINIQNHIREMK